MQLYLSGCHYYYKYLKDFKNLGYLVSYYYLELEGNGKDHRKLINHCNNNYAPLMLDSGAYSAMNKNITIDNDRYIDFCKTNEKLFDLIVSLDVIGNYKDTAINHAQAKQAGLNSLPTFHIGSPFDELNRLIDNGENYIGLGGIAGKGNQKKTRSWLDYIYNHYNVKFHGFGVTTPELLIYPWYSIDGTTPVTAAIIYGRIMIDTGNGNIQWIHIRNKKQREQVWHIIKDDFGQAWDIKNNKSLPDYSKIAVRHNVKTLLDVIKHQNQKKRKIIQQYLL